MHMAVLGELYSGAQVALIQLTSPSHCALYPRGHAPVFGQILAVLWLCWGLVKPAFLDKHNGRSVPEAESWTLKVE